MRIGDLVRCLFQPRGENMKTQDWRGRCQECYKETSAYTMSMYSTLLICMACKDEEKKREDYEKAVKADINAIISGDFNFKGINER